MRLLSLVSIAIVATYSGAERTHPDFSGTWVMNKFRTRLEIAMPDSSIFHVRHDDPVLTITRIHAAGGKADTITLALRTDGTAVELNGHGVVVTNRTWWDGDEIVSESHVPQSAGVATNIVRYSLSADGDTFYGEERFQSATLQYHNRWVFDRR